MKKHLSSGIVLALLAALISGISIFYNKLVIVKGIDPTIFNIVKNGGVAIIFSFALLAQRKLSINKLSAKAWTKLFAIALIGGSVPFILYFEGLRSVSAVNANLIHKTMFIWVAILAIPILGEKLTLMQVCGYILILLSNLFIGGFRGFSESRGELLIFLATLLWAGENIIAKIALKELDALVVGWARMFLGTFILVGFAAIGGKLQLLFLLTTNQLWTVIGSILFLSLYVFSWFLALKRAPATVVTSILVVATVVTNILSSLFITHSFLFIEFIYEIIITLGISLIIFSLVKPGLSRINWHYRHA